MGPPGGGRNDITGRFTRHLQVVSIDEFDDQTMTRIFTSITDWHFAKGFDAAFARNGKVGIIVSVWGRMGCIGLGKNGVYQFGEEWGVSVWGRMGCIGLGKNGVV